MIPEGVVPEGVMAIWDRLCARAGSYLVGGAVRDLLLGRVPKDYDIATELMPEDVAHVLGLRPTQGGRFGSVRVPGLPLELVSMRSESQYSDRRRPDRVQFGASLARDLGRRDFTVNAMALDRSGQLIDPHGGERDLSRGLIRCVGQAEERLSEDLLRVLRAYRFAAELGFRIAPSVRRAAAALAEELREIAPERIGQELMRLLAADGAFRAIHAMAADGILPEVMPGLRPIARDYPGRMLRLAAMCIEADPVCLERLLTRLGWPEDERRAVTTACRLAGCVRGSEEAYLWRRALAEAGDEAGTLLVQVGGRPYVRFARLYGIEGVLDRSRLRLRGLALARAEGLEPNRIGSRERELLEEMWRNPRP